MALCEPNRQVRKTFGAKAPTYVMLNLVSGRLPFVAGAAVRCSDWGKWSVLSILEEASMQASKGGEPLFY